MNYGITPNNQHTVKTTGPIEMPLLWAQEHESKGTYNYEGYVTHWTGSTSWYFSREDDAILFALKFK